MLSLVISLSVCLTFGIPLKDVSIDIKCLMIVLCVISDLNLLKSYK